VESFSKLLKQITLPASVTSFEEKKRELLAHPMVSKLIADNPAIQDEVINLNITRINQYVNEYNNCSNCPGLDRCPNDQVGYYTMLSIDETRGLTQLNERKVMCKKLRTRLSNDEIRKRIRSFYIDEQLLEQGYEFDEIMDLDPKRRAAVAALSEYMNRTMNEGLQKKGLYLVGEFGTGKTYLMCYFLSEMAKIGFSGVIVYMPDFMEDLKAMFQDPQKLKDTIEMMKQTDILIFDDIGAENMNPWLRDHVMGSILNYRMNRKPTFYTSNFDLDRLELHFSFTNKEGEEEDKGKRIMERIRTFVDEVKVSGANKRGLNS
jgi:primosomal protein DnaI